MVKKLDTHIVIKKDDIFKYLTEKQRVKLGEFLGFIDVGRHMDGKDMINTYYVVNTDEPYAEEVYRIIELGEQEKDPEYRRMRDYYNGEYS